MVEAAIGQLQAEGVCDINAATYRVGGLVVGQVLSTLEDEHEGQAPEGRARGPDARELPLVALCRKNGGEALPRVEEAAILA